MTWLKTRKIKICICGRNPNATIIYDDKMQARSWLMVFGTLALLVWGVLSSWVLIWRKTESSQVWNELKGAWWFLILVVYWCYIGVISFRIARRGHSFRCAARQAFLKAI